MKVNQTSSILQVRVQPKGSIDRIDGFLADGSLKVKVTAPAEKGKANQSVLRLLASHLGVSRSQVELVSGHVSPRKIIRVIGLEAREVRQRLTRS